MTCYYSKRVFTWVDNLLLLFFYSLGKHWYSHSCHQDHFKNKCGKLQSAWGRQCSQVSEFMISNGKCFWPVEVHTIASEIKIVTYSAWTHTYTITIRMHCIPTV